MKIPFTGLDAMPSFTAQEVLRGRLDELGQKVAVIGGGMAGCETAEFIVATGREVTVIEMMPTLLSGLFFTVRDALLERLKNANVQLLAGRKVQAFENDMVKVATENGGIEKIGPVHSVVLALGVKPFAPLEAAIKETGIPYVKIGDCLEQGNCLHATRLDSTIFAA